MIAAGSKCQEDWMIALDWTVSGRLDDSGWLGQCQEDLIIAETLEIAESLPSPGN